MLVAALSLAGTPTSAAPSDRWQAIATPIFRNISANSGLPSASEPDVFSVDGDGYMWVGTQSGLLRWDGYHFKRYVVDAKDPGSIPDNYINTMHTDPQGRLWIGTNVGGVARYDRAHDRFIRYGAKTTLEHATAMAIVDDGAGGLWIGSNRGLNRLDVKSGAVTTVLQGPGGLPADSVDALMLDHEGRLWVGTPAGLFKRTAGGKFQPIDLPQAAGAVEVTSLAQDSRGAIWIGTMRNGVFVWAPGARAPKALRETEQFNYRLSDEHIPTIAEARPGQIWVGTYGHGIVVVDTATMKTHRIRRDISVPVSLSDDTVLNIVRDASGLLWVATNSGINIYNPAQSAVMTVFGPSSRPHGLTNGDIQAMTLTPDGRLWLGLGADGVDILSPSSELVAHLAPDVTHPKSSLPATFVDALVPTLGDQVYLGTGHGLFRANAKTKAVAPVLILSDNLTRVRALLWQGGYLWVGEKGLTRFRIGVDGLPVGRPEHLEKALTDVHVSTLAPGPDGSVWVGTHSGLNRIDRNFRVVDAVAPSTARDGLMAGGITSMLTDRFGRLWVASTGSGINVMTGRDASGTPRFRHLSAEEGLPDPNADQLLSGADGVVWVSTDDGLARIDPPTLAIARLQGKDGVYLSTYWNGSGTMTPQGEVLFGGVGGMTVVRPDQLRSWPYQPPIVVTDAARGGKPLLAGEFDPRESNRPLSISADANNFRVEFSALDYSSPDFNRYAYQLVGYDSRWIETDAAHRVATYTNLWPGHYELRLRGSNRLGAWSTRTLTIPIDVLPHWYQTPLFYLVAVLLGLGAVSGIVIWRTAGLRRQRRELEHQVAERTAQLQEQTKLALAASQAKSAFLAMMSHELRTPMNGVLGMARALKMTSLDDDQNRQVDMIVRSGDTLMTILNDILDISKIEAGKLELEVTDFDLIEVGQTAFDLWSDAARKKGVKLVYDVDPATPRWVRGDSTRVRQIVLNLVSNALKFTDEGQVRLALAPADAGIAITVADTGIGISPEQQARLFQSFSQADASTSRRFGGTGLGLAICKQLAELMGGGISLKSAQAVGTTFTVVLPLPRGVEPARSAFDTAAADEGDAPPPLAGVRLLVVDDNTINLAVANAILGAMGAAITTAADGQEAVEILSARSFDLVLMDLQMPRMNGSEALAVIRGGRAGPADMPVIALTANVMAGETERLLALGFDDVQPKPISPEGLIDSICTVLSDRGAMQWPEVSAG